MRYGAAVRQMPSSVPGSDASADVFQKGGFDIIVHYREGQAWHLFFTRRGLIGADECKVLFTANLQGMPLKSFENQQVGRSAFWVGPGGSPVATLYRVQDDSIIELMVGECVKSLSAARAERIAAAWTGVDDLRRKTPTPVKKKDDSPIDAAGNPKDLRGF